MAGERRNIRGSNEDDRTREKEGKGSMTVEEAGHKGGQRVRELIEEGKKAEGDTEGISREGSSEESWSRRGSEGSSR
jgi:hypothetical protein